MMGQLLWWAWAGLLGSTLANASVELGSIQIELNHFTHHDRYEWNAQKGAFEHVSQSIRYTLRTQGRGKFALAAMTGPAEITTPMDRSELQVLRRGDQIELQWFKKKFNVRAAREIPTHEVRRLKLSATATWTQFENGQVVEGVIEDIGDSVATEKTIRMLAEDIYQLGIKPEIEEYRLPGYKKLVATPEPTLRIAPVAKRVVRLSKTAIEIESRSVQVYMEPVITGELE